MEEEIGEEEYVLMFMLEALPADILQCTDLRTSILEQWRDLDRRQAEDCAPYQAGPRARPAQYRSISKCTRRAHESYASFARENSFQASRISLPLQASEGCPGEVPEERDSCIRTMESVEFGLSH